MAVVNVSINGRVYDIACADDQAERVEGLGREVGERAQKVLGAVGAVGDPKLLVMVGLMFADELAEARDELLRLREDMDSIIEGDSRMAEGVEDLAERIEAIADRLERA